MRSFRSQEGSTYCVDEAEASSSAHNQACQQHKPTTTAPLSLSLSLSLSCDMPCRNSKSSPAASALPTCAACRNCRDSESATETAHYQPLCCGVVVLQQTYQGAQRQHSVLLVTGRKRILQGALRLACVSTNTRPTKQAHTKHTPNTHTKHTHQAHTHTLSTHTH